MSRVVRSVTAEVDSVHVQRHAASTRRLSQTDRQTDRLAWGLLPDETLTFSSSRRHIIKVAGRFDGIGVGERWWMAFCCVRDTACSLVRVGDRPNSVGKNSTRLAFYPFRGNATTTEGRLWCRECDDLVEKTCVQRALKFGEVTCAISTRSHM